MVLRMNRTKVSDLIKIVLFTFLAGFGLSRLIFIPLTYLNLVTLGFTVVAVNIWVSIISKRLPKVKITSDEVFVTASTNPLPPLVAARTAAFALAGSRVGAILVGFNLGIATNGVLNLQVRSLLEQTIISGLSALISLFLVLISLRLERKCSPPQAENKGD